MKVMGLRTDPRGGLLGRFLRTHFVKMEKLHKVNMIDGFRLVPYNSHVAACINSH